jgi:dTDP-4-amino-4,6-dideoxygalactose transaminase
MTFCGTVNPVVHTGATPVFVDVLAGTYEMDPDEVTKKKTARTVAIIPVHIHGMPCNLDRLSVAAAGIPIIEDACQAHGAEWRGRKVGSFGKIACFSLNQVKPLGAGQGGLVVTNDWALAEKIRLLASHGGNGVIGWSYGITEFAAALTRTQLKRLDKNNEQGRRNAACFAAALAKFAQLLPIVPQDRLPVWHKYRVRLPQGASQSNIVERLRRRGVECDTWPNKIVPDLDGYKKSCSKDTYPVAKEAVVGSVIIGSEDYPLACQTRGTIERWADIVQEEFSET